MLSRLIPSKVALYAATPKSRTLRMQKILKPASLITVLILSGCASMKTPGTATERTLCRVWGESLPTRSRSDTQQTQTEISEAYADFATACPDYERLIP